MRRWLERTGDRALRSLIRTGGFLRRDLVALGRQPRLVLALVLGPLAVLLLFGAGVRTDDPPVRTIFVVPEGGGEVMERVRAYAELQEGRLDIVDILAEEEAALAELRAGTVDLVVTVPGDVASAVAANRRAAVRVAHTLLDPIEQNALDLFTRTAIDDLNSIILAGTIEEVQEASARFRQDVDPDDLDETGRALLAALDAFIAADADVLANPLEGEVVTVAGSPLAPQFYGPAVLALVVQHLLLTFAGLSVASDHEHGVVEVFRLSPTSTIERVVGKTLAYLVLAVVLSAVLLAGLVGVLGAPLQTGIGPVALVVALEALASVGIGVLLGSSAASSGQVVQVSLLLLLLAVFFGGFVLSPARLQEWAAPIGWVLPMTHALVLMRDSMFRGDALDPVRVAVLVGMSALFLLAGWMVTRLRARAA